jgi:hypothetical protein
MCNFRSAKANRMALEAKNMAFKPNRRALAGSFATTLFDLMALKANNMAVFVDCSVVFARNRAAK